MKVAINIIIFVVLVLLLLLFTFDTCNVNKNNYSNITIKTRIDTITIYDTVYLPKTVIRTRLKVEYDTLRDTIKTLPFKASLDTIDNITQDTLKVEYKYPENIFVYELKRKPLEQKTQYINRYDTIRYETEKSGTVNYIYHIISFIGGFITGRSLK